MDIFEIRRARLRSLVEKISRGNLNIFAARFGYSRSQISQYLSETYNEGRSIGERVARAIEEKVSAPSGWLDAPIDSINLPDSHVLSYEDTPPKVLPEFALRLLPVVGTAITLSSGLVELRGGSIDRPRRLAFVTRWPNAYAVCIGGTGLESRMRSKEYIIIEPSITPGPGDDALLKLASGEHMVLQYLYTRDDELTFREIGERGETATIQASEIVSIATITSILSAGTPIDYSED